MNRFCVVLFVGLISCATAEPPSSYSVLTPSISYGPPQDVYGPPQETVHWAKQPSVQWVKPQPSVEWVKPQPSIQWVKSQPSVEWVKPQPSVHWVKPQPSVHWVKPQPSVQWSKPQDTYGPPKESHWVKPQVVHTDYWQKDVGHQTSEGLHLDQNLLHKISDVLISHENSQGNSQVVSVPSHSYGVPQSTYGVPHWSSSKVVGIDFGHLRQSIQVAQLIGKDRYAPSHQESGWNVETTGWKLPSVSSSEWSRPSGWEVAPRTHIQSRPSTWAVPQPAGVYGAPSRW